MPTSKQGLNLKQTAHALIDQLPDTAGWDELISEMQFRKAVEEGLAQAEHQEFATESEVREVFAKWGVKT